MDDGAQIATADISEMNDGIPALEGEIDIEETIASAFSEFMSGTTELGSCLGLQKVDDGAQIATAGIDDMISAAATVVFSSVLLDILSLALIIVQAFAQSIILVLVVVGTIVGPGELVQIIVVDTGLAAFFSLLSADNSEAVDVDMVASDLSPSRSDSEIDEMIDAAMTYFLSSNNIELGTILSFNVEFLCLIM